MALVGMVGEGNIVRGVIFRRVVVVAQSLHGRTWILSWVVFPSNLFCVVPLDRSCIVCGMMSCKGLHMGWREYDQVGFVPGIHRWTQLKPLKLKALFRILLILGGVIPNDPLSTMPSLLHPCW